MTDLCHERLRTVFYDIGAVVYFRRLVVWIVPDFTIEKYRGRLLVLHDRIEASGRVRKVALGRHHEHFAHQELDR